MLGAPQTSYGTRSGNKVVLCGDVEAQVFAHTGSDATEASSFDNQDPEGLENDDNASSTDEESDGGVAVHFEGATVPKTRSSVELTPQQLGRLRAANREKVRQAARRGVAFGFAVDGAHPESSGKGDSTRDGNDAGPRRQKVEAVQGGKVVESSFAKGEWGVRWRDNAY